MSATNLVHFSFYSCERIRKPFEAVIDTDIFSCLRRTENFLTTSRKDMWTMHEIFRPLTLKIRSRSKVKVIGKVSKLLIYGFFFGGGKA